MKPIFLFFFLFVANQIFAQRFEGGIMAGAVASQLDGDHRAGYHKLGFLAGGFVKTKLKPPFGMQMEIKFIQKGSKGKDTLFNTYSYYASRLNYIEIPILLSYTYKEKFAGYLGASAGYLISAFEDKDSYGFEKAYPEFDKFEISGHAAISYKLTEKLNVMFMFSYSAFGVRDAYPDYYQYIQRGQYNNVLSLSLYYQI